MCRTAPNQSALESTDPGALNGESNFEIKPLGADLVSFEVAKFATKLEINWQKSLQKIRNYLVPAASNVTRSVHSGWISKSDPPLNAPGSGLSSALRISEVRHL